MKDYFSQKAFAYTGLLTIGIIYSLMKDEKRAKYSDFIVH